MNASQMPASTIAGCCGKRARTLEIPPEFLEMLPIAVYACDGSGRVLWFNSRAAALWGRSPRIGDDTELFCGSHKLYFGGRQIGREETPMARVLETGTPVHAADGIFERPDGSRVWVTVHIDPVLDEDGEVVGAVNCFHETSELHRVSDDLHQKQRDLEDFFENGAVALHLVAGDGTILRANKAELDLLGYTADDYIGRDISEFHADSDVLSDILACLKGGQKLDRYPARLRAKDGSIKHVQITSNAQFRDGKFLNTRCFTVDVTESKSAQERLEASERQFRQLLDALPAAVYTTDAAGRVTYYNQAAIDLAGRRPELGSDQWCVTWRLYWPDGTPLPHDECPMAVALKEGRAVRGAEAVAERPDGTRVPFIPYPTPFFDADGRVVGAVNMLVDVSARREAETQQRILRDEVNHRVKNNMQMLYSLLWSAKREARSPEAQAVLADASQRVAAMAAAQRMLYGTAGPDCVAAKDFLTAVCTSAQQVFPKSVRLVYGAASGELPNDAVMPLSLILNELLTNAVKHGTDDGAGVITVGLTREADLFVLSVEDRGAGFDLAKGIHRRSSGLGLVMGLAGQLRGKVEVERTPGARCIVRFPAI
jgi:PAS domain S-box-containing protein